MTGRTKTYYIREAIIEHLDCLEDLYLVEKVVEDIRSGREKLVSLDELIEAMAWKIEFAESASRTLGKLDKQAAKRIVSFLKERVIVIVVKIGSRRDVYK